MKLLGKKKKRQNELENLKVQTKRQEKKSKEKVNKKWLITIVLVSFCLSVFLSFVSELTIPKANLVVGIIVCLIFVFIGILFDIIGVSVTSADPKVFHSMSSRKVRGASIASKFIKNSEKVSSFCCDVIGDICGVLSGAISAIIAVKITETFELTFNIQFIVSALVAAITVGGKAIGKEIANKNSTKIVHTVGIILNKFSKNEKKQEKKSKTKINA